MGIQWERFLRKLTGGTALIVMGSLVFVHLMLMIFYVHGNRLARHAIQRDAVIQKIANIINLVKVTPVTNRESALEAQPDPYVKASISSQPLHQLQFRSISIWDILHALRKQEDDFSVSIQLLPRQWLNISATVVTHFVSLQLMLLAIEVLVISALFLSAWSVNRLTKPLEDFQKAALAFGENLTSLPEEFKGPAVVQDVVTAVKTMQERIASLLHDRTKMLAAISHDLRTPITRMTLRVQLMEEGPLREKLLKELEEMSLMINETLAFARSDSQQGETQKVDIVSMLQSICDGQRDLGFAIDFSCAEQRLACEGRPIALRRAFTNLITNACRYGDQVTVETLRRDEYVCVRVLDNGPGIPDDELEAVFKPFYRLEKSRSRDSGGVGLGLATTRDIVAAHGGTITLSNREKGGLQAMVLLPFVRIKQDGSE